MLGLAMGRLRLMIQGIAILGTEHRLDSHPAIELLSFASLMECCIGNKVLHQGLPGAAGGGILLGEPRFCLFRSPHNSFQLL
jgi:hypothetical protein